MIIGMTSLRLALLSLLWVVGYGALLDAQATVRTNTTGLFGRLEYHKESGDVVGLEVFIMKGRSAVVSFEVRLRSGDAPLRYSGTVRRDGLFGKFDNAAFSDREDGFFLLRRGRSYWQD